MLLRIGSTIATWPAFDPRSSDRRFCMFASDQAQPVLGAAVMALSVPQSANVRFDFPPHVDQPYRRHMRGKADLLIIPAGFISPDHSHEALYRERFVCAAWCHGNLAGGRLAFERPLAADHVVMQPEGGREQAFEGWLLQHYGVTRRVMVQIRSFITLPTLLVGTDGVATVHERVARRFVGAWPLEIQHAPMPIDDMEQAMQWHKLRSNDPGLLWLGTLLAEAARRIDEN